MYELSEKERKVLQALLKDSNRSRKATASSIEISESEFSKLVSKLEHSGVIKNFTVNIDYKKIGYPDQGLFIFSMIDKKFINQVVEKLKPIKEIVEIQEVFGEEHDMFIRIMAEDNERIRQICRDITNFEEVNGNSRTFTMIFASPHRKTAGVEL